MMVTKRVPRGTKPQDEAPRPAGSDPVDDGIDEALVESFPASDPPAWTLGTDHRAAPKPGKKSKPRKEAPPRA